MDKTQEDVLNNTIAWLINQSKELFLDIKNNGITVQKFIQLTEIENRMYQWKRDYLKFKVGGIDNDDDNEGENWKYEE